MTTKPNQYGVCAGLLLCGAVAGYSAPVTFQVDMTRQIADGAFIPGADRMQARGSFQGWTGGFWLTNDLNAANTNIYSGVYSDADSAGTTVQYKFVIIKSGDGDNSWNNSEQPSIGNRTYVATGSALVLPAVYYANKPPTDKAATHPITFQVNMGVQMSKGNFSPWNGDTVEVRGEFQTNASGTWSAGSTLTMSSSDTNVYVGTFYDNNATGAQLCYKFVINPGGSGANWEGIDGNRVLIEPGDGGLVIPAAYYANDIGSAVTITFQVDMSAQVLAGRFVPGTDYVEARGSFQSPNTWTGGFALTNITVGGNTNIYSGAYVIGQAAGTVMGYKFYGSSSALGWESPASTGGGNRTFTTPATNYTLPLVFFNDQSTNDFLPADTVVTFNVNMTNATAYTGGLSWGDGSGHSVYINGVSNWWTWVATVVDPVPGEWMLTNNPIGSQVYSLQVTLPKGTPVRLEYKYSIDGYDNEMGAYINHVRFVRKVGACELPLDTFGTQYTEPAFGSLAIGQLSAGRVPVSWLGRPGVNLQVCTSLSAGSWQNLNETDGGQWKTGSMSPDGFLSSTNYPVGTGPVFFRLVKHNY